MAKQPNRNRGYPVFAGHRRSQPPREKVPTKDELEASQQGDVFTYIGVSDLVGPYPPVADMFQPEYVATFASNFYYNCIEIDATFPATLRGWSVPDLFKIAIDDTDTYFSAVPSVWGGEVNLGPRVFFNFSTPADALLSWRYSYQCPKTYIAPVAFDPTNTSTLYGKQVFRLYGMKPFRCFKLGQWTQYAANHSIGELPMLSFRVWHDKKTDVPRST